MYYAGCKKDEVFVGNTTSKEDLSYLKDVKYRLGDIAYDIYGEVLSKDYMLPLFVKKESYDEYNKIMMSRCKDRPVNNFKYVNMKELILKIEKMYSEASRNARACKSIEYDYGWYNGKEEAFDEVLKLLNDE